MPYSLVTSGIDILKNFPFKTSQNLTLIPSEKQYYKVNLSESDYKGFDKILIKTVSLNCLADLYVSKSNPKPNSDDNDANLQLDPGVIDSMKSTVKYL